MPSFKLIEPFKQKLQEGKNLPPPPWQYQSAKSPACLGLRPTKELLRWRYRVWLRARARIKVKNRAGLWWAIQFKFLGNECKTTTLTTAKYQLEISKGFKALNNC